MDIHHEPAPFQISYTTEDIVAINLVFLLHSEWARGMQEICMVSILEKSQFNLLKNYGPLLKVFTNRILEVPEGYKALYFKNFNKLRRHPEIGDVHQNLSLLLENLYRKIPRIYGPCQSTWYGLLGLPGSGKRTLLSSIQSLEAIGENIRRQECCFLKMTLSAIQFVVFDWDSLTDAVTKPEIYGIPNGLLLILDGSASKNIIEYTQLIQNILESPIGQRVPIAILNNKRDAANYSTKSNLAESLQVNNIKHKTWQIFDVSALTGLGVLEALEWIFEKISGEGHPNGI